MKYHTYRCAYRHVRAQRHVCKDAHTYLHVCTQRLSWVHACREVFSYTCMHTSHRGSCAPTYMCKQIHADAHMCTDTHAHMCLHTKTPMCTLSHTYKTYNCIHHTRASTYVEICVHRYACPQKDTHVHSLHVGGYLPELY